MFKIYTDGGSRGNPGPAAGGCVIYSPKGELITESAKYVGIQTNNYAEYSSLILGINKAIELGLQNVTFYMDSMLVVQQVNKRWKCQHENLVGLLYEAMDLLSLLNVWKLEHIPRRLNVHADRLVNEELDRISTNNNFKFNNLV